MSDIKLSIGIDVSKDTLDFCEYDFKTYLKESQLSNLTDSIEDFLGTYDKSTTLFVLEPTGTYSDKLVACLSAGGYQFSLVNPRQSHYYGLAKGILNKDDKQASRMLAEMGATQDLPLYKLPSTEIRLRKSIIQAINGLDKEIQVFKNRIHALEQKDFLVAIIIKSFESIITNLELEKAALSSELKSIRDEDYDAKKKLAETVIGVGPSISSWVLTTTDGLTNFHHPKKLMKFFGLAPKSHESGSSVRIKGGINKMAKGKIRGCLYMGALSALKTNKACKDLYERLRKRKPHYKAMVAVMCKLLKQLFGVIKSGKKFDNDYYLKYVK